ncbi:hypothetical protein FISHEDRAFT_73644 [Fistulina hepatica ATCC 64428]|uniref:Uncharacterized protein n=1 Tax=Fistulina hepatica ATCC 64428 TaxID=1128425 RepID=A0A0D7AC83_9AGAR|nr:hypothetical protein FISHEDRAFT_73644 [Fistulina hepatica ATCC 64428]
MQPSVDDSSASRNASEKVLYDNMVEILTCRHCGHDAFPPLPTRSFDVHELKEVLRNGFLPSSLTMKCIEQEITNLEAAIKEVSHMLEDARAALNPVVEYLAVARSISSPIRRLPVELLSNVFSYLIASCSDENELRDAMFEAGILGCCGSTIHQLASVCKYWWCVVRDTPVLYPVACVSYGDKSVLAVRQYIEMTSPHPLKLSLRGYFHSHSDIYTPRMEEIDYCTILRELVNASSRWQTADLGCSTSGFWLENALDVGTEIAASICHSSYPVLKELCLYSLPVLQFFSQEQVPALRVLRLCMCQIELHAVQPILLQITNLELCFLEDLNVDLDFHAILSYSPVLSQLTVYSEETDLETYVSRIQSDDRSPVLLSHLRRLHINSSIFMLNIITAPNLVHFHLHDDLLHSNVVDAFLRRSRCNIESLHLDIWRLSMASSIIGLSLQMPHVTHLAVPADQNIWVPLKECTRDGRFSVFPQLRHLEIDDAEETRIPYFSAVSEMMQVVLKRCGARKIRVEGRTGYRKSKKPPVLRRLNIRCPLTRLQHQYVSSDDDNDGSDGEEEVSSNGDDDGVAYI